MGSEIAWRARARSPDYQWSFRVEGTEPDRVGPVVLRIPMRQVSRCERRIYRLRAIYENLLQILD
jgi:hypothetical protein